MYDVGSVVLECQFGNPPCTRPHPFLDKIHGYRGAGIEHLSNAWLRDRVTFDHYITRRQDGGGGCVHHSHDTSDRCTVAAGVGGSPGPDKGVVELTLCVYPLLREDHMYVDVTVVSDDGCNGIRHTITLHGAVSGYAIHYRSGGIDNRDGLGFRATVATSIRGSPDPGQ